jgi:hypothetical protein
MISLFRQFTFHANHAQVAGGGSSRIESGGFQQAMRNARSSIKDIFSFHFQHEAMEGMA